MPSPPLPGAVAVLQGSWRSREASGVRHKVDGVVVTTEVGGPAANLRVTGGLGVELMGASLVRDKSSAERLVWTDGDVWDRVNEHSVPSPAHAQHGRAQSGGAGRVVRPPPSCTATEEAVRPPPSSTSSTPPRPLSTSHLAWSRQSPMPPNPTHRAPVSPLAGPAYPPITPSAQ
eukprot:Hpha_TRINITY_DN16639_c1_g7::TRINITY_DN16639_c1_g7_i1::g.183626::m.183626